MNEQIGAISRQDDPRQVQWTRRRRFAFVLMAYAFAATMLGTTLPTPLYPLYQTRLGISELMVTIIYAVYAVGVIAALIVAGGWSDQVGRRRMLFAGIVLSGASAVVFLAGGGLMSLFIGRVFSGLSAGIVTGTGTVAIVELAPDGSRGRATLVATAANMGGLGLGPLLAGLLAQYTPLPLKLCFIVDLALLVIALAGVWCAPETVTLAKRPRLRPQRLQVPSQVRAVFVPSAIVGFAGFAVLGLFTAVAPAFLGEILKLSNHALTGGVVFVVFAASTLGQLSLKYVSERWALPIGCLILAAGGGLLGVAIGVASLGLLIAGGVVSGIGQGLAFRAGMAAVTAGSPPERRGEVASTFFVVLYVAISIPVIGVGVAAEKLGLRTAGVWFAIVVAVLALIALLTLAVVRGRVSNGAQPTRGKSVNAE
ncbi:MAG: MFS transporter [Gammaproteobacteria bacterium]